MVDDSNDVVILDKLDRQEPLLPGRRAPSTQQSFASTNNANKLSREKSNYAFDEQHLLRTNTGGSSIIAGLTQEALNELVPASRLASRKLYHDIVLRNSSAAGNHVEATDDQIGTRRVVNSTNLAPIKSAVTVQRGNVLIVQQTQQSQKLKPRSLPNSSLDHANQHGFHLPYDPHAFRASKTASRTLHIDHSRKTQPNSPVRYNPGKSNNSFIFSSFDYPYTVSNSSDLFGLSLHDISEDHNHQVLTHCCVLSINPPFSIHVLLI